MCQINDPCRLKYSQQAKSFQILEIKNGVQLNGTEKLCTAKAKS